MTPIGMAIGLGVRETYDPDSATALIVQGCLDSFSAGILLYTGLVELLAHEFIFQQTWKKAPMSKVLYAFTCLILGTGIMALLGRVRGRVARYLSDALSGLDRKRPAWASVHSLLRRVDAWWHDMTARVAAIVERVSR